MAGSDKLIKDLRLSALQSKPAQSAEFNNITVYADNKVAPELVNISIEAVKVANKVKTKS